MSKCNTSTLPRLNDEVETWNAFEIPRPYFFPFKPLKSLKSPFIKSSDHFQELWRTKLKY